MLQKHGLRKMHPPGRLCGREFRDEEIFAANGSDPDQSFDWLRGELWKLVAPVGQFQLESFRGNAKRDEKREKGSLAEFTLC